jgi:hypothetical protein
MGTTGTESPPKILRFPANFGYYSLTLATLEFSLQHQAAYCISSLFRQAPRAFGVQAASGSNPLGPIFIS